MNNALIVQLYRSVVESHLLCAGRAANILYCVLQASPLPGDMAEFGCHAGHTASLMAACCDKPLWLFDSFEGLPERQLQDKDALGYFDRGAMAVEQKEVIRRFAEHGLREPIVYKAWFRDIPADKLPERLCFAHLDGDLYSSIRDSIQLVYPRLVAGGICVIDDYGWTGLSGVKIAVDEYMKDKPERVNPLVTGNPVGCHAAIVKQSGAL